MKRKILLLTITIFIFGCFKEKPTNEKTVKLRNGKTIKINLEIKENEANEKVLFAEYKNLEKIIKEKTIEDEVLEIWKAVEQEADKLEIREGVIKYTYLVGKTKNTNEAVFVEKLFSAEKIENGTWKIRKVN